MKARKATLIAVAVSFALITGGAVCPAASADTVNRHIIEITISDTATAETTTVSAQAESGVTVTPSTDANGRLCYQITDETGTYTLSQEEYRDRFNNDPNIARWTYDEYSAWLEEEKAALQSYLGTRFADSEGEHVYTQEIIDEIIAGYEHTLARIKSGTLISKPIEKADGTQVQLSYDPLGTDSSFYASYEFHLKYDGGLEKDFGPCNTAEELYALVKPYCEEQVRLGTMTRAEADRILAADCFESISG